MVEVDTETLLNASSAAVATVAALFFVVNVELGHSPVSKFGIVAAFLAGLFAVTQSTGDRQLTLFGYAAIVTTALGLFFEVVGTFDVGDALTAFGLLVVAGLLFALRTRSDEDSRFVEGRTAKYAFAVVAALAVAVLLVDVVTGGLAYELQPRSEIEVADRERDELRIGTVVVSNPTPLPERVRVPNYAVCTAGNWSAYERTAEEAEPAREARAHLSVHVGYREHVFGFGEKTYPVEVYVDGANLTGETFPVRRTSACPSDESGRPYLALFEAPGDEQGHLIPV